MKNINPLKCFKCCMLLLKILSKLYYVGKYI